MLLLNFRDFQPSWLSFLGRRIWLPVLLMDGWWLNCFVAFLCDARQASGWHHWEVRPVHVMSPAWFHHRLNSRGSPQTSPTLWMPTNSRGSSSQSWKARTGQGWLPPRDRSALFHFQKEGTRKQTSQSRYSKVLFNYELIIAPVECFLFHRGHNMHIKIKVMRSSNRVFECHILHKLLKELHKLYLSVNKLEKTGWIYIKTPKMWNWNDIIAY